MNHSHPSDESITSFIDEEITEADRQVLLGHLRFCSACRARVDAESTARSVVRAHAAAAKAQGLPPAWRPRVYRLGRPLLVISSGLFSLLSGVGVVVAVLALWPRPQPVVALCARSQPVEAVCVIGDSRCGPHHRFTALQEKEPLCAVNCVRLGADYILVSGEAVYEIANQQFPGLADFAGRQVAITGSAVAEHRITVSRIVAVTP